MIVAPVENKGWAYTFERKIMCIDVKLYTLMHYVFVTRRLIVWRQKLATVYHAGNSLTSFITSHFIDDVRLCAALCAYKDKILDKIADAH